MDLFENSRENGKPTENVTRKEVHRCTKDDFMRNDYEKNSWQLL